ncbi:MAG: PEP/pyruvate-binding domain-containing protein [Anaerolineae bacterium]
MLDAPLCAGFDEISRDSASIAGGKGANLGELAQAGLPVPPGFVVCTPAYRQMVETSGVEADINRLLAGLDRSDSAQLREAEARIRRWFDQVPLEERLARRILERYQALGHNAIVAVRSSATAEDLAGASFAGQQETFLNVRGGQAVLEAVRRCWASLYTSQAIFYRRQKGFDRRPVSMAVVVQRMIACEKSGVLFTVDPILGNHFQMMIEAVWGLGEGVVSGKITPDSYKIDREDYELISEFVPKKSVMVSQNEAGGIETVAVPPEKQSARVLTEAELIQLVDLGNRVEAHFGCPQDIEWGIADGRLYLLQSRPITAM